MTLYVVYLTYLNRKACCISLLLYVIPFVNITWPLVFTIKGATSLGSMKFYVFYHSRGKTAKLSWIYLSSSCKNVFALFRIFGSFLFPIFNEFCKCWRSGMEILLSISQRCLVIQITSTFSQGRRSGTRRQCQEKSQNRKENVKMIVQHDFRNNKGQIRRSGFRFQACG